MNMKTACLAILFAATTFASGASSAATCKAWLTIRGYDYNLATGTWLIRTNQNLNTTTFITGTYGGATTADGQTARNRILSCWQNQFVNSPYKRPDTCTGVVWGGTGWTLGYETNSLDSLALQNIAQGTPINYNCAADNLTCFRTYPNVPILYSKTTINISGNSGCSHTSTLYQWL